MEYKQYGDTYYVRMDKGDEIIEKLLTLCKNENISSCTFSGIGGCGKTEILTFIPELGSFESRILEGMLELVSLTGNIITDESDDLFHHTHAIFSYIKDGHHEMAAGHMKSIYVSYTAEITLKPVIGGAIKRQYDKETGTGFWDFK